MSKMIDNIQKYLEQSNETTVAFDCFDTVISRYVSPNYVKRLWAQRIVKRFNLHCLTDSLYQLRLSVESDMQLEMKNNHSLNYLFFSSTMADKLIDSYEIETGKEILTDFLIDSEYTIECQITYVNEDIKNLLAICRKFNKRIILISDYHLNETYIKALLKFHGIEKYFDHLFVSCDYCANKLDGSLYIRVMDILHIDPQDMIMIGDHISSDFRSAIKLNIKAFHIERKEQYSFYNSFEKEHSNHKTFVKTNKVISKIRQTGGLMDYVFAFYAFIDILYNKLLEENARTVYFFAREGKFLKTLFDIYQKVKGYPFDETIKSEYLIVSRKSTYLASRDKIELETFTYLKDKELSMHEFFNLLNIDSLSVNKIKTQLSHFDFNHRVKDFTNSDYFKSIKSLDVFLTVYEENRCSQNRNLLKYLEEKISVDESNLYVVDVGWKGSIQDNIYKLYKCGKNITGYYIGNYYSKNTIHNAGNRKQGLLFSYDLDSNKPDNRTSFIYAMYDNLFYEIPLYNCDGSASHYLHDATVVLDENDMEINFYNKVIRQLQEDIISSFKLLLNEFKYTTIRFDDYKDTFLSIHLELIKFINENKYLFKDFYSYDNFCKRIDNIKGFE